MPRYRVEPICAEQSLCCISGVTAEHPAELLVHCSAWDEPRFYCRLHLQQKATASGDLALVLREFEESEEQQSRQSTTGRHSE